MYLHLGQNTVVPMDSILGVFDLDNTTGSHITRQFLKQAEQAGQVKSELWRASKAALMKYLVFILFSFFALL